MATTSFAGRRPQYVESYARTAAAFQRYQDISRDIQAEQDRLNYLDSLIQSERQNLTNLNEVFRVRPQDLGSAQALLQQTYASEDAERRRVAAGAAGRAAGLQLPREARQDIQRLLAEGKTVDARDAALRLITADTTPEQGRELVGLLQRGGLEAAGLEQVRGQLQRIARGRAPSGAARALAPEEQAAERALQQQLEAAFFAGPAGIRGGYDGQAIVERRASTAAPEGVSFSTEEDAFQAALAALQDGTLAAEDFASEEDFAFAKALYDEAAAKQAYRNDQRVNFEAEVLTSRQRVAELQQARATAPGAQYTDPGRERARRELIARGYDPELNQGRYLQYQKSPYYKAMVEADDILNSLVAEDVELQAVGKAQRLAADLIRQLDATGRPYDITKVEKQLGKVLKGEELQQGLAFALATKEYDARNLASPNQRELQRAAKEREAKAEEQARELDATITRDLEEEADRQFDFARRLKRAETKEEAFGQLLALQEPADFPDEPAPAPAPAPAAPREQTVFRDPTDPNFVYRRTAEGFQVFEKGRRPYSVPSGSRPAQSIEQVLAGGAPLPPQPRRPAPAPVPEPEPDLAADILAAGVPTEIAAPAGEAEPPAPKKRLRYNPATGRFE
jgi:hypothetical protein